MSIKFLIFNHLIVSTTNLPLILIKDFYNYKINIQ